MICSSLCRVPFIAVLLLRFERTHILRGPVFGGWVTANNSSISARSKNSTVRRTQHLPEIAKILWQRSMGVVSVFRLPANPQCMHCVVFSRFPVQL